MKMEGLDYNTQREDLKLPEYGREIQKMVEHAIALPTKEERQRCSETIIDIMQRMSPQGRDSNDHKQKLWDHLAIMSGFRLDIDYPYDVSQALKIAGRPEPMAYPMQRIPVRHYGHLVFELFEKLKTMPAGAERDQLTRMTANQMQRDLHQWSHTSADHEKIADDLARYTDGVIQIDPKEFEFERINTKDLQTTEKRKKKR